MPESPPARSLRVEAIRLRELAEDLDLRADGDVEAFTELSVFTLHRTAGRIDTLLTALAAVEDVERTVIPLFHRTERTPR